MEYGAVSIPGKVRDKNEDDYLILDKEGLHILAVADGMGGHKAGDVASSTAIKVIKDYEFKQSDLSTEVQQCINIVNNKIIEKSRKNSQYKGMGTTLTLAVIENNRLIVGHIGDSRAYLYHDNSLEQITNDHSYVADLLQKGAITEEEAENHPKKNLLLQALGLEKEVKLDIIEYKLVVGDMILLCSDGLTNMRTDKQIKTVLEKDLELKKQAELLSDRANAAGGYDNITAVLYQNN